jgi:hypothetical protein
MTLGPRRGRIRATNDQIAADNSGHYRVSIGPGHRAHSPFAAGCRDRLGLPDTEEVLRCRDQTRMLIWVRGLTGDRGPQAVGGGRWRKEAIRLVATPTSTP